MMGSWDPTLWEWLLPIPIADIPISHSIKDRDTIALSGKQYNIYIYIHKQHPFINQTMNNIHEPWKTLQISSARAGWSRLYTCHIYIYILCTVCMYVCMYVCILAQAPSLPAPAQVPGVRETWKAQPGAAEQLGDRTLNGWVQGATTGWLVMVSDG